MNAKCVCPKTSGCNKGEEIFHKGLFTKVTELDSVKEKKRKLAKQVKEKEEYFYCCIKRNRKLKREKEGLDNEYSVLKEETEQLKDQLYEVRQRYRDKEHSLAQQTSQLNQCRAEYSKINQKYLMLCVLKSQAESLIAENRNASPSSSKVQRGATSSPSTSKQGPSTSRNFNDKQGHSGEYNPVNIQLSASLSSTSKVPSERHNKTKQVSPRNNKIQCSICLKIFSKLSALACHQRVHYKRKPKRVRKEMGVNGKRPEHLPQYDFQCPECSRICLNACGLANHRRSHRKEQQINASIDEVHHLNQDIRQPVSSMNEFRCPDCFKICVSAVGLASHRKTHSKEQQKSNKASNLNETKSQSTPQANEFQCEECSKICLNACGLANHRRSHARELQKSAVYESSDLENKGPHSDQLQQREVDNEKLDNTTKTQNRRQVNRAADGKYKKRYMCKEKHCNKIFYYPAQLREHENKHTGKKPYMCEICFKSFSYRASVYTHSLTHSAFRAHKCPKCSYSFTQQAHLRRHMLIHQRNNLRAHKCPLCGASFISEMYMKQHVTRIHFQQSASAF